MNEISHMGCGCGSGVMAFSFFLIEVQLIYSVVLISAVQQSDSVIYTYIHSFLYSFPLWFISGY